MQITREPAQSANAIIACLSGEIRLRDSRHTASVIVTRDAVVSDWRHPPLDELAIEHFAAVIELGPEIVLLGTGPRQRFPHPRLTHALMQARVGVEVMDTSAACRTYNILMAEERLVAAALLVA